MTPCDGCGETVEMLVEVEHLGNLFSVCGGRCAAIVEQRCRAALALVRARAIRVAAEVER